MPRTRVRAAALAAALLAAGMAATGDGSALASFDAGVGPGVADTTGADAGHLGSATPLDGTYRVEILGSRGTYNGHPHPRLDAEHWYAISTSCAPRGCAAHALQLDSDNQRFAHPIGRDIEMTLEDGRWVGTPFGDTSPCLAMPQTTVSLSVDWVLTPDADGRLRGTRSITELPGGEGPCAGSGGVHRDPMVVTRIGPLPDLVRKGMKP